MRRYSCPVCANEVFFENTSCVNCNSALGYEPGTDRILANPQGVLEWHGGSQEWAPCANRTRIACNWLTTEKGGAALCLCCRHTSLIPDLGVSENQVWWERLERAKRALFYSILRLGLPLAFPGVPANRPLTFEFKADEFTANGWTAPVMTGHENGIITINVSEADDLVRERQRTAAGEPYRTLVGHFRHEIGHYYWNTLIANTSHLWRFRELFGNERQDYATSLRQYYSQGANASWQQTYVSPYASSHPWEDFAETWAHYFHIVDGLETARSYFRSISFLKGNISSEETPDAYVEKNFKTLMDEWIPLTIAMNAINRSIGHADFYPFVLSDTIFRN